MRKPLFWLLTGGVLVGGVLAALLLVERPTAPTDAPPAAPIVDAPAPNFTVTTLDGETLRLSDLRGKPVFLNFWATWCIPCRAEMPAFAAFTANRADEAVILAVNADREPPEAIRAFLDELNAQIVPVALDPTGDVRNLYAVNALPTTYFIDAAGTIRTVRFGEVTTADLNEFLAFLERTER